MQAHLASKEAATVLSYAMAREKSSSAAWVLPKAACSRQRCRRVVSGCMLHPCDPYINMAI